MTKYLVCRLRAPFAAWGEIAINIERPSSDHPSKSAVMGLVAASLGIVRNEEDKHRELAEGYNFAVLVNAQGNFLRDFHTTQMPSEIIRKHKHFPDRAAELALPDDDLETIVSTRDYYTDVLYTIAIWIKEGDNSACSVSLETLEQKLKHPEFVLYLGRKSCPLSLPVEAQILECDTLVEALEKARFKCDVFLNALKRPKYGKLYWEGDVPGLTPNRTAMRRDQPLSRTRWQFINREEHCATIALPEILEQEV